MKIKQEELTKKTEKQDYLQDPETTKYSEITRTKLKRIATKMVSKVVQAFKHNSLIQTRFAISGRRPMTFTLESNTINLPLTNYKEISSFCNNEDRYGVNIYFETISEYVNVSHSRTDILGSGDEIAADPDKCSDLLFKAIEEKIEVVRNYQKPEPKTKVKKTK